MRELEIGNKAEEVKTKFQLGCNFHCFQIIDVLTTLLISLISSRSFKKAASFPVISPLPTNHGSGGNHVMPNFPR